MLGEEIGAAVVGVCSLLRVLAHCSSNEPIPTQALFIRHYSNFRAYYLSFFPASPPLAVQEAERMCRERC